MHWAHNNFGVLATKSHFLNYELEERPKFCSISFLNAALSTTASLGWKERASSHQWEKHDWKNLENPKEAALKIMKKVEVRDKAYRLSSGEASRIPAF